MVLANLPERLAMSGNLSGLARMLQSVAYLAAKIVAIDVNACLVDFDLAASCVDAGSPSDDAVRSMLGDLSTMHGVLRREADHLRDPERVATPGFVAQQLRNSAAVMGADAVVATIDAWLATLGQAHLAARWGSGGGAMPLMHTLWIPSGGGFAGPFALTADCRHGLFAMEGGHCEYWDLGDKTMVFPLRHPSPLADVAIAANGQRALTACRSGELRVWDLVTRDRRSLTRDPGVDRVAVTADGRIGASASADGIEVWDLHTGERVESLDGPGHDVLALTISSDGDRIAVADRDGGFSLWDLHEKPSVSTFPISPGGLLHFVRSRGRTVAIAADCRVAVCASQAREPNWSISVWDLDRRAPIATFTHARGGRDLAVAITPDGRTVATASGNGTIHVWDVGIDQPTRTLSQESQLCGIGLSEDGRRAVTTTSEGASTFRVRVWDLASARVEGTGHDRAVVAVALSGDGSVALSGSHDGSVRLWDGETGALTWAVIGAGPSRIVSGAAVDIDGRAGLTSFLGGELWSWNLERRVVLADPLTQPTISVMAWSEAEGFVVTASPRRLGLWHLPTRREASIELPGIADALALLPGGARVVVDFRERLAIYSLQTGEELASLATEELGRRVASVLGVVPGTGEVVIATTPTLRTSVLHFLDPVRLRETGTIETRDIVLAVSINDEGDRLVSTHDDGAIRVWDLTTSRCRAIAVLDSIARAVAIRHYTVLVGDAEGSLHCFDLAHDVTRALADAVPRSTTNLDWATGVDLTWRDEDPERQTERALLRARFELDGTDDPEVRSELATRIRDLETALLPEDERRTIAFVGALRRDVEQLLASETNWWATATVPGGPELYYYIVGWRYPTDLYSAQSWIRTNDRWAIIDDREEERIELWIEGRKFGNLRDGEVGVELARALADPRYR